MGFLNTPHKKKSALLTSMITLLLLLFFSWIGLSYFDPPISYGMEVNFGTTNQGQGNTQPKTSAQTSGATKSTAQDSSSEVNTKSSSNTNPKSSNPKRAFCSCCEKGDKHHSKPKVEKKKTPPKEVQEEVKK